MISPTRSVNAQTQQVSNEMASLSYVQRLLATVDNKELGIVNSYRDIFPEKFNDLVKLQLSYLVDVPCEILTEEIYIEASPLPVSPMSNQVLRLHDDESFIWTSLGEELNNKLRPKSRKSRILRKFPIGRLLHNFHRLGRRDACNEDTEAQVVEIKCVREEQLANFAAIIDYLLADDNFAVEGLFRKSGNAARQRELEALLNAREPLTPLTNLCRRFSVHDAAAALKSALGRLPEPLLTRRFAPLFVGVVRLTDDRYDDDGRVVPFAPGDLELLAAKQVKALRLLYLLLPDTNRQLLHFLLTFLTHVADQSATRMDAASLGIVFAPALFGVEEVGRSGARAAGLRYQEFARCVALMIEKASALPRVPRTVASDVSANLARISQDPVRTCVRYAASAFPSGDPGPPSDITRLAVAELYAEVARWPDTERKRKMVRRLNNLNGGFTPARSPCIDYMQRTRTDRCSVRRRLFHTPGSSNVSIPSALNLVTPVRSANDLPSLISFSEPLSPDEHISRWRPELAASSRCSPRRKPLSSQTDLPPVMSQ